MPHTNPVWPLSFALFQTSDRVKGQRATSTLPQPSALSSVIRVALRLLSEGPDILNSMRKIGLGLDRSFGDPTASAGHFYPLFGEHISVGCFDSFSVQNFCNFLVAMLGTKLADTLNQAGWHE